MFCKKTNLHSLTVSLLLRRKAGKNKLVSITLLTILLCIGSCYTYAQTDSAVIDYKNDTTHLFTVTKSGKVGVGTGTPQAQLHTTGTVRFAKFANNTYEDSVLTTDESGNLKFIPRWSNGFGGVFTAPREVKFKQPGDVNIGKIGWDGYQVYISSADSTSSNSYQRLLLYPEERVFFLESQYGQNSAGITGEALEGGRLSLRAADNSGSKGITIAPQSITFQGYKNNLALDSVLTLDATGNLKLIPKWNSSWGDDVQAPTEVKFVSDHDPMWVGNLSWGGYNMMLSTADTSFANSYRRLELNTEEKYFELANRHEQYNSGIRSGFDNDGNHVLSLYSNQAGSARGINIYPYNIQLTGIHNNAAGDSVLTTDANGFLKLKAISVPSGQDSSWANDTANIWNKNKGNVGIGTQMPTARFHTLGSMRFESFKNNLQGDSVLTTDVDGNLKFVYMPYGSGGGSGASYSFQNGIIQNNGNVSLGGLLQDSVKINLSGHQFSFNNGADKVLHMSADGNVGIGAKADANYKMNVYGDVILGHHFDNIGGNEKLSFGGTSNTDALYFQRYNTSANATDLRVNIGDDGGNADRFVVGYTPYSTTNWNSALVVEAGGRMGIGTDQITGELSVGLHHGSKLSVGNNAWTKKDIIVTSWDNINGDYTDLLVPGNVANSSFMRINQFGNVGIGTLTPDAQYKLSVNGRIRAKGMRVQSAGWSDFVFEPDYKLLSLPELEKFVKANKHLPEIPTAQDVMTNGQEVGEIQSKLLQKIEELTLYTIELNKQVKALEDKNKKLEAQQQQISQLQQQMDELKKLIGK